MQLLIAFGGNEAMYGKFVLGIIECQCNASYGRESSLALVQQLEVD